MLRRLRGGRLEARTTREYSMPLSPDLALQGAVFAHLSADATLPALIGTPPRVYDQTPDDPIYPFVQMGQVTTRPWGGLLGDGIEHVFTMTCVSRFGGAEEAKAVMAAVRDDTALTLTDNTLVNLRFIYGDVFRAADWRSTFAILRFRAVTEPND
jgi:hypothetical protein